MIGKTLGHYEVLEPLGAGGMGKVYRARDTKLDRHVALKILPADFADDYGRLKRFQQEAKLLAALSDPNIAAVYDFDSAGTTWFLAQEYIEGQPLSTLLKFGALGVEEALNLARQIAAGIEAAHAKGIVHRDLKPSNVMVTADNKAKVLDFGIATPLAVDPAVSSDSGAVAERSADPAETPTDTGGQAHGLVMGTAGYMSPDQARGRDVDERTDIWSFGAVLYEMLAGKQAFEGDTMLDKLAHIVRGDVDWDGLPASTPPRIRALLRRCLQKDLTKRLQHIGDARIEIEEVLEEPELYLHPSSQANGDAVPPGLAAARPTPERSGLGGVIPWAVAGIALVVAAAAYWSGGTGGETAMPPQVATAIYPGDSQELTVRPTRPFDISPDGSTIVYVASEIDEFGNHSGSHRRRLYRRSMTEYRSEPIPGTEGADNPFFSHDGRYVGFFSTDDNKLKKVLLSGGGVDVICDVPAISVGASWGPDDHIVFATMATALGLSVVSAIEPGEVEPLTEFDAEAGDRQHGWPRHLPDGNLLYSVQSTNGSEIRFLDVETKEWTTVLSAHGIAQYVSTGHLVYADADQLLAVPFDLASRQVTGSAAISVVDDLYVASISGFGFFSVSDSGILVYVPGPAAEDQRRLVWVNRAGDQEPLQNSPPGAYSWPAISPNGQRIAVTESIGDRYDIWLIEADRGSRTPLTNDGLSTLSIWSPDGQNIAFGSRVLGAAEIHVKRVDRDSESTSIQATDSSQWPRSWSPDGTIAYYEMSPDNQRDIYTVAADGQEEPTVFLATEFNERGPAFSPDGHWIAYVSNKSGRDEVYIRPNPQPGGERLISTDGGAEPVWAADGRELFYRAGEWMMAVPIDLSAPGPDIGHPVPLFQGHYAADLFAGNQNYDVHRDGRFLMISAHEENLPTHLNVVLNWVTGLREQVAAGR